MTHDGEPDSYEYASRLATWIWEKHYKNESPHWKPLNDLLGVLTQIDNMTTGLVRSQPETDYEAEFIKDWNEGKVRRVSDGKRMVSESEPVAWMHIQGNHEDPCFRELTEDEISRGWTQKALYYTAPPQREFIGLTDEEMMIAAFQAGFDVHEDYDNEDDPDALHWWSEDGDRCDDTLYKLRDIILAKLREKNGNI